MLTNRRSPWILVIVAVLILGLVMTFSTGCGTETASEEEQPEQEEPSETSTETPTKEGGSIVIAMQGNEVPPPDAHDAATISDECGASMFSEPLVIWKDGEYLGLLAESWEVSDDGLNYTFKIRPGVEFHNGEILNAEMVKDNIDRIKNPDDPKYAAGTLSIVTEVEVIDDSTVALHLDKMDPDFLSRLTAVWILEPSSWGSGGYPAGTGPLEVTEYIPDESLVVQRFDNYWGEKAFLDEIRMRPVPDPSTLVVELETGGAHLILFAPPSEGKRLEEEGYNVIPFGRVNWARVAMNMTTVTEKPVREALAYAIDTQAIIDVAYAGYGDSMDNLVVPGSWADSDSLSGFSYDPEKVKQILDEAGFVDTDEDGIREIDGKKISLHLPTRGDDSAWLRATQMIQKMAFDVGIATEITTAARLSYYEEVRTGKYDITWWLSNAVPEPPVAYGNLESVSYWNVSQYPKDHPVQQQLDELIQKGRSVLDKEERASYYHELNELYIEEAIEAPGMWLRQIYVADPSLKGMYLAPTGVTYEFNQWYLEPQGE